MKLMRWIDRGGGRLVIVLRERGEERKVRTFSFGPKIAQINSQNLSYPF